MALQLSALFRGFGSWKKQTKEKEEDPVIIIHKNDWIWGTTYNFILGPGRAILKLSIDSEDPKTGILSGLSVLPGYQGMGYGKKILERAIEVASGIDLEFLEISVEKLPENEWIRDWYKRIGFSELPDCEPEYIDFIMYLDENEGDKGTTAEEEKRDTTET